MKITCPDCNKIRKINYRENLLPLTRCASCAQIKRYNNDTNVKHQDGLKKCCICKEWKELSNYTKNKIRYDGMETFCKECNTIRFRLYRKQNRRKVRELVYKSIRKHQWKQDTRYKSIKLYPIRQLCSIEGCFELGERHHEDYSKPLDIVWLCRKHHREYVNTLN